MRWRRYLEAVDGPVEAGSAGALAGQATPTPSADGFHGCQDGGGRTQPTDFRIIELLGSHPIQGTRIHCMAIEHTGN